MAASLHVSETFACQPPWAVNMYDSRSVAPTRTRARHRRRLQPDRAPYCVLLFVLGPSSDRLVKIISYSKAEFSPPSVTRHSIQTLPPQRRIASVAATPGYERIAALTCAVTALPAPAGQCVAVGSPADGYILLPALASWGLSDKGDPWAQRKLRQILCQLSCDKVRVHHPQKYDGAEYLDLNGD